MNRVSKILPCLSLFYQICSFQSIIFLIFGAVYSIKLVFTMRAVNLAPIPLEHSMRMKSGSGRQSIRLEAIAVAEATKRARKRVGEQQCNRPQDAERVGSAQSALLRQLKKLGLRTENQRGEELPAIHSHSPPRHALKRIENCQHRQENRSMDGRSSRCKSFLIRKKNISVISKKAETDCNKAEHSTHPTAKQERPQYPSNFRLFKNLRQELNTSINSRNSNQIMDKPLEAFKDSLHSSIASHKALKVKPIICKTKKKMESIEMVQMREKYEQQHKEESSGQKIHKKIDKMIKKVRKLSHSEYELVIAKENGADSNDGPKREKSLKSTSNDAKGALREDKEKGKLVKCCKTVRIFWGETKQQPQEEPVLKFYQNEGNEGNSCDKLVPADKEDIFGCISMITRRSDVQFESFRELLHELYLSDEEVAHEQ